jgi:chorismate mutase
MKHVNNRKGGGEMELKETREVLDKVDRAIVLLLAKRLSLLPHIVEHKIRNNLPRKDPEREKDVIGRGVELGKRNDLRKEYVEDIFRRIIEESHYVEKKMMGK